MLLLNNSELGCVAGGEACEFMHSSYLAPGMNASQYEDTQHFLRVTIDCSCGNLGGTVQCYKEPVFNFSSGTTEISCRNLGSFIGVVSKDCQGWVKFLECTP